MNLRACRRRPRPAWSAAWTRRRPCRAARGRSRPSTPRRSCRRCRGRWRTHGCRRPPRWWDRALPSALVVPRPSCPLSMAPAHLTLSSATQHVTSPPAASDVFPLALKAGIGVSGRTPVVASPVWPFVLLPQQMRESRPTDRGRPRRDVSRVGRWQGQAATGGSRERRRAARRGQRGWSRCAMTPSCPSDASGRRHRWRSRPG